MLMKFELEWRTRPTHLILPAGRRASVALARWSHCAEGGVADYVSDVDDDSHVLNLLFGRTRAELAIAGKTVLKGAGTDIVYLNGPKHSSWTALLYGHFDALRIHIPQELLRECYESIFGKTVAEVELFSIVSPVSDKGLQHLARSFRSLLAYDDVVGPVFVDALGIALAARLVELHGRSGLRSSTVANGSGTARLTLVKEYIDANLDKPLYIADLSVMAGLNRLQFVTQFKSGTGFPPHAYILRRRIERAQQMLSSPSHSIVDIALELGFSSQGHFSETFKRMVGISPGAWRKLRGLP